jgi:hypothetical protein
VDLVGNGKVAHGIDGRGVLDLEDAVCGRRMGGSRPADCYTTVSFVVSPSQINESDITR